MDGRLVAIMTTSRNLAALLKTLTRSIPPSRGDDPTAVARFRLLTTIEPNRSFCRLTPWLFGLRKETIYGKDLQMRVDLEEQFIELRERQEDSIRSIIVDT